MAKLFKQKHDLHESDTFYIVAKDKKEAEGMFVDNTKEILEYLTDKALPFATSEVEEISDLTPEEEQQLKGVIWDRSGLRAFLISKGFMRLREVV